MTDNDLPRDAITVDDLSLRFGGTIALDHVSFSATSGEIAAVIGPNGAGKTSLFNCLSGYCTPSSGEILVHGHSVTKVAPARRVHEGLARTFQSPLLFRGLSVIDNVLLGMHARSRSGFTAAALGLRPSRREERRLHAEALDLLGVVGLSHHATTSVEALAYGPQKRVELARALASGADILLLDEPVAGLNPSETEEFAHLLLGLHRDRGLTVLLVEHDMHLVMDLADRVVVLDFGRKIAEGSPREVQSDPAVIEAFLGVATP